MAAEQTAHTEVPPKSHFPPFQADTFASQLFWFAVTFVALYVIISRFAIPRIGGIFELRRARVESDLAEARRLKEESDAAIAAYERVLADARGRAQALANEAREKFAAEAEAARRDLDAVLNARIAQAEQAIADRRRAAMTHIETIASEAASAIVEQLVGKTPAAGEVARAVAGALKR